MNVEITDIKYENILTQNYDLGIVAAGFEERCTLLSSKLDSKKFDAFTCMRFTSSINSEKQLKNSEIIYEAITPTYLNLKNDDDKLIYEHLNKKFHTKRQANILIDYSSMTRSWYGAILNWAFHTSNFDVLNLDFCYVAGNYDDEIPPIEIKEILCIPGCEGTNISSTNSVAIFGLGFDPWGPLCVIDKLEPDEVFAIVADPGASSVDSQKACEINREIIEKHARGNVIRLPISSVEVSYQRMLELISPYRGNSQISIICLGPKPHVLASILLSMYYKDVASLHISNSRKSEYDVKPAGPIICSRVQFRKQNTVAL